MRMRNKRVAVASLLVLAMSFGVTLVQADLAKESADRAQATSETKATPDLVKERVDAAAALLEAEGAVSYPKFRGGDSEFIYAGTYIWINDLDGVMLMHPIKPKLEGKTLLNIKDKNGKRFFVAFIDVAKDKNSGWVDYLWPKPGEKKPSQKISYVKKVTIDGKDALVGSGIYDVSQEEIDVLVNQ